MNVVQDILKCIEKYCKIGNKLLKEETEGKIKPKKIKLDLSQRPSKKGGSAWPLDWKIWINTRLHELYPEHVDSTVGHEIAHIYSYHIYGNIDHSYGWQKTMNYFGLKPEVYHRMEKVELVSVNRTVYIYTCLDCGEKCKFGSVRHNKVMLGSRYYHKECRDKHHLGIFKFEKVSTTHKFAREQLGLEEYD